MAQTQGPNTQVDQRLLLLLAHVAGLISVAHSNFHRFERNSILSDQMSRRRRVLSTVAVASGLAVASLGIGAGVANAGPPPPPPCPNTAPCPPPPPR